MAIDAPPKPEPPSPPPARRPPSLRGPITLIVVVALALLTVGVLAVVQSGNDESAADDTPTWFGRTVDPAAARPSFTLTDTDGQPYDFATETDGKLTFLFFGYTHCPDICPISMATLTSALDELKGVAATVVFVTTDPDRDTPQRIDEWLSHLPFPVVGLTGSIEEVEAAQEAAGITVAIPEDPDAEGEYEVGHASAVNVYTPDDLQHLSYPAGTVQSDWMADIPRIATQADWSGITGLEVTEAYAGPTAAGTGAVYLTITNGGDRGDELLEFSSPSAAEATLHVTDDDGAMQETGSFDIPAGTTAVLAPGGDHLMLDGVGGGLSEGDTVQVVLRFRNAGTVTLDVPVVSYDDLAARIGIEPRTEDAS